MVSKGQFVGLDWNRITRLHSQAMTGTQEVKNSLTASRCHLKARKTYTWLLAHASDVVFTINNRQYKNYKLTRFVAQLDWKISQVEAVQFCCSPDICKNKVNYYNCISHDNNNQSKKPSSFSILVLIVLGYCYSTDFTCVQGKQSFSLENGTML